MDILPFIASLLDRSFEKQEKVVLTVLPILWTHNPPRSTRLLLDLHSILVKEYAAVFRQHRRGHCIFITLHPHRPTHKQREKASQVPLQSLVLNSPLVNSLSKDGVGSAIISNKGSI